MGSAAQMDNIKGRLGTGFAQSVPGGSDPSREDQVATSWLDEAFGLSVVPPSFVGGAGRTRSDSVYIQVWHLRVALGASLS